MDLGPAFRIGPPRREAQAGQLTGMIMIGEVGGKEGIAVAVEGDREKDDAEGVRV